MAETIYDKPVGPSNTIKQLMIDTNDTLLGRLRVDNAHDAWKEFFDAYWGAILRYGRKLGLNAHQAEEVLQETMVALMRILPEFAYDRRKGRFRNFLLTIVHRKALSALKRDSRLRGVAWDELPERELSEPCENGGHTEMEALARWRDSLMEEAIRRLRADPRLAEKTVAVFEAYVVKRQLADDVARRFGLNKNAVYQIRTRLLRRVQAEVAALMKSSGGE